MTEIICFEYEMDLYFGKLVRQALIVKRSLSLEMLIATLNDTSSCSVQTLLDDSFQK